MKVYSKIVGGSSLNIITDRKLYSSFATTLMAGGTDFGQVFEDIFTLVSRPLGYPGVSGLNIDIVGDYPFADNAQRVAAGADILYSAKFSSRLNLYEFAIKWDTVHQGVDLALAVSGIAAGPASQGVQLGLVAGRINGRDMLMANNTGIAFDMRVIKPQANSPVIRATRGKPPSRAWTQGVKRTAKSHFKVEGLGTVRTGSKKVGYVDNSITSAEYLGLVKSSVLKGSVSTPDTFQTKMLFNTGKDETYKCLIVPFDSPTDFENAIQTRVGMGPPQIEYDDAHVNLATTNNKIIEKLGIRGKGSRRSQDMKAVGELEQDLTTTGAFPTFPGQGVDLLTAVDMTVGNIKRRIRTLASTSTRADRAAAAAAAKAFETALITLASAVIENKGGGKALNRTAVKEGMETLLAAIDAYIAAGALPQNTEILPANVLPFTKNEARLFIKSVLVEKMLRDSQVLTQLEDLFMSVLAKIESAVIDQSSNMSQLVEFLYFVTEQINGVMTPQGVTPQLSQVAEVRVLEKLLEMFNK